ncbi:hypothetical protein AMJ80_05670 [bacterium SM23_31]|nr:MAG: hypothetical protein AMJ80_05670 [bacterium SM23_31]
MNTEDILALFDIDGTLLHPGTGARKSLSQAIFEETKQEFTLKTGDCAGKTDQIIITDLLTRAGCAEKEIPLLMESVIKRYIELMKVNYNAEGDAHLYSGVQELIDKLQSIQYVHLGLLTGNIEEGARIKLGPFNLNDAFPTGAFGDDGFLRTDLPRVAVQRAEKYYTVKFSPRNIVVIGDTASDIKCGKVIQARTIGIYQHLRNEKELKSENPDYVFHGFDNTDETVNAILDN